MCDLSSISQFWLNWWVQLAVAIATVSAVLVALFGQGFRAKFFPPQLSLALANSDGEKTRVQLRWIENDIENERMEDSRYYRIRVTNARRWSPANQVQVVLLQVEEPAADGQFTSSWVGDLPLIWKHQPVFPVLRTIGPDSDVDLCSVVKDKWLQLHPLIPPFDLEVRRRDSARMILSLQARANESDSQVIRVEISWDGKWHDGTQEMKTHLIVKVV